MALRGHRDNVRDLRISRDAQRLVTASSDKCVRTWDLRAPGRSVAGVRVYADAAWALAPADEDQDHVYSDGRDGKVRKTAQNVFVRLSGINFDICLVSCTSSSAPPPPNGEEIRRARQQTKRLRFPLGTSYDPLATARC